MKSRHKGLDRSCICRGSGCVHQCHGRLWSKSRL